MPLQRPINGMRHSAIFFKFGAVGLMNTTVDFAIFISLVRFAEVPVIWANAIAFAVAVNNSFLLNQRWTFKKIFRFDLLLLESYLRFVAVSAVGMIFGTLAIYYLDPYMPLEFAKIASISISLTWNYLGSRHFVFMKR